MKLNDKERKLLEALCGNDSYGLELMERTKLGQQVYPLLRRLEAKCLLTSYEGEPLPERGHRPRRYYSLTGMGKAALAL